MRWAPFLVLTGCMNLDFHSDGTSITATGHDDGSTDVSICAGPSELLSCNSAPTFQVQMGTDAMTASTGFLDLFGTLSASFPTNATDSVILVSGDGGSAVASLPPTFDLVGPTGAHSVHDDVTVTWDARHGRDMTLATEIDCENGTWFGDDHTIADSGSVTTNLEDVHDGWSGNCRGVITVFRNRTGRMDGFPDHSSFTATQKRSISFALAD